MVSGGLWWHSCGRVDCLRSRAWLRVSLRFCVGVVRRSLLQIVVGALQFVADCGGCVAVCCRLWWVCCSLRVCVFEKRGPFGPLSRLCRRVGGCVERRHVRSLPTPEQVRSLRHQSGSLSPVAFAAVSAVFDQPGCSFFQRLLCQFPAAIDKDCPHRRPAPGSFQWRHHFFSQKKVWLRLLTQGSLNQAAESPHHTAAFGFCGMWGNGASDAHARRFVNLHNRGRMLSGGRADIC